MAKRERSEMFPNPADLAGRYGDSNPTNIVYILYKSISYKEYNI